jgi:hypothetical protein
MMRGKRADLKKSEGLAPWSVITSFVGLIGGILGIFGGGISIFDRFYPPSVEVIEVRPVYVYAVDKVFPRGSDEKKLFYDEYFSVLIRLQSQNRPVSISGMEISGRIFLDFDEWFGFKNEIGTIQDIEGARKEQRPYYNVSFSGWITDSKTPLLINSNEEHYIRFDFSTADATPTGIPIEPAYLGTENPPKAPEIARVRPRPTDILEIIGGSRGQQRAFSGLRSETANGHLKWYLTLGSRRILIPVTNIQGLTKVSEEDWSTKPPKFLFSVVRPDLMPF